MAMATMDPLLLAASFSGSPVALRLLLDGEGPAVWADGVPTPAFLELLQHGGTDDEEGVGMATSLPLSPSLLDGVTAEGDTALHVVATNGDGARYLRSASFVHGKARHLIYTERHAPPLRRQGREIFHGLPPRRASSRR